MVTLCSSWSGQIGTMIAERAHAFGMHVIATRDSGHEGPNFCRLRGRRR